MKVAWYKGTRPGIQALFSVGVRLWRKSIYSHCEVVFSDGMCASSSFIDGGVRFKQIDLKPEHWDVFDVAADEAAVRAWYAAHAGCPFDVRGLIGVALPFIGSSEGKFFCSESVLAALGFDDAFRFAPDMLAAILASPRNLLS